MEQINSLNKLSTPCYILNIEELEKSIRGFQTALDKNFTNAIIGYSVKTNSTPYCMKLAGKFGAFAEVVSSDEYELARLCGFNQDRIIYNGPMKSKETFIDAIINGAIVNIEAKREIDWLSELPRNNQYNIGIRLNINISHISPEDADGNDDLTINDVTQIQNVIAGTTESSAYDLLADVNGNGKVDIRDATYIQLYLAKYIEAFPSKI
jgi:diaminopimelate decarboxylase